MPVILQGDEIEQWLEPINNDADKKKIESLIKPFKEDLEAYTVRHLRGKESLGNVPEAANKFDYPELSQETLF